MTVAQAETGDFGSKKLANEDFQGKTLEFFCRSGYEWLNEVPRRGEHASISAINRLLALRNHRNDSWGGTAFAQSGDGRVRRLRHLRERQPFGRCRHLPRIKLHGTRRPDVEAGPEKGLSWAKLFATTRNALFAAIPE